MRHGNISVNFEKSTHLETVGFALVPVYSFSSQ